MTQPGMEPRSSRPLASTLLMRPIVRETGVQSQVKLCQRPQKMVLDAALLNTQHYKVRIEGKVEQSREWSSALPYTSCPRGVMVKAMNCGIVVREFVLQSRYYVHFRANTLGKGMRPFILPAMG